MTKFEYDKKRREQFKAEKKCIRCKASTAHSTNKNWCTVCVAKIRNERRGYREKLKAIVYQAYGNQCQCCGEATSLFLTIDHVNNDGYKDRNKAGSFYARIIAESFPDRYQLLCFNCNCGRYRNNGVCPHKGE